MIYSAVFDMVRFAKPYANSVSEPSIRTHYASPLTGLGNGFSFLLNARRILARAEF